MKVWVVMLGGNYLFVAESKKAVKKEMVNRWGECGIEWVVDDKEEMEGCLVGKKKGSLVSVYLVDVVGE